MFQRHAAKAATERTAKYGSLIGPQIPLPHLKTAHVFCFFCFFIRVKSIHTGTQGGEASRLTRRLASTRTDYAPRQPPESGVHSKVPTAPGSGGHLEVPTAPGSRGFLEVPTSPGSGGHLEVPTSAGSKSSGFQKANNSVRSVRLHAVTGKTLRSHS